MSATVEMTPLTDGPSDESQRAKRLREAVCSLRFLDSSPGASAQEIAAACTIEAEEGIQALMDRLIDLGLVSEHQEDSWQITPVGEIVLRAIKES